MATIKDFTFETGAVITDASGEAMITLSCFNPLDTPCVVLTSYDIDGNSNANLYNLVLTGNSWTAKVITSAPEIKVYYRAFTTTLNIVPPAGNNIFVPGDDLAFVFVP